MLLVTRRLLENMKARGAVGAIWMRPLHFLYLTASSPADVHRLLEEAAPLSVYNDYISSGEIDTTPFLRISIDTSFVERHEGRHRCAALYQASPNALVLVSIVLLNVRGIEVYEDLSPRDIPPILFGQYMSEVQVRVNLKKAIDFWHAQPDQT